MKAGQQRLPWVGGLIRRLGGLVVVVSVAASSAGSASFGAGGHICLAEPKRMPLAEYVEINNEAISSLLLASGPQFVSGLSKAGSRDIEARREQNQEAIKGEADPIGKIAVPVAFLVSFGACLWVTFRPGRYGAWFVLAFGLGWTGLIA